ncbi:CHASE2 domain-containing protein [Albimonas sp. CAU 1670]|uniref:adenylate/guanylate cyclase domain-containing protein n=1 Tax=Albimonas sp. CAU 1670 TaxID=3032599 RepID=UPI0023DABB8B|nr:CHASE2 domain-containing protein [Albimonas sp. CAU 1670]MDF2233984.1 CHASE2 domain-containing protein [Albimonas sp. CAU 1670]
MSRAPRPAAGASPKPRPGSGAGPKPRPAAGVPPLAAALLVTLLFALWRAVAGDPWTDALDRWTADLRFQVRGPWPAGERAAVIAIDEAALAEAGRPAELRSALARALPLILAQGPASVALDLLLVEGSPSDPALAAALAGREAVFLAAAGLNAPGGAEAPSHDLAAAIDRSAIPVVVSRRAAAAPAPLLAPVDGLAQAARLGHVNLLQGADRVPREAPMALEVAGGRLLPSIALASAAVAEGGALQLDRDREVRFGDRRIALLPGDRVIIDHPGGPGAIPQWPLGALLAGEVPPGALQGRMVFVGATAESLRDVFVTPYAAEMPGVAVLAGLAAGLAEGRTIRRDAAVEAAAVALALLLCLAVWAAHAPRLGRSGPALGLVVAAAGAGAAQWAFASGLWLDGASLVFGALAGLLAGAARRRIAAGRAAAALGRERANLAGFVPPALADLLARGGAEGFVRRAQDASVIFVDVEGFTTRSERMSPLEVADFLAALHAVFEAETAAQGGVVVDWQGDGAMIAFGLPDPAPDDAARALACAVSLAEQAPARLAERMRTAEAAASRADEPDRAGAPGAPPSAPTGAAQKPPGARPPFGEATPLGGGMAETPGAAPTPGPSRATTEASSGAPKEREEVEAAAPLRLRVSLHHGPTAAAALGGARQAVVTLAGDTVNLASRLQDIARRHGRGLVATREALDAAGDGPAAQGWRFLEHAEIRGRDAPAEVWSRKPGDAHARDEA